MSRPVILVPLDGSRKALSALPVAKVLGEIERADLRILYVAKHHANGEELRRYLASDASLLEGLNIDARSGTPAMEILRAAQGLDPCLIVLCRESGTHKRKMLGSTAMKVLQGAHCPVVLVPPERGVTPWHLQHVLVPHDGTPSTSVALQPAAEVAESGHAELLVVHVCDTTKVPQEAGSFTAPCYVDQPQHEWPAWASEFSDRLACICPLGHAHVRLLLAHGDIATQILHASEKQSMDLIVLAWRGLWGAPHAVILKDILRQARCPIMVVRTEN